MDERLQCELDQMNFKRESMNENEHEVDDFGGHFFFLVEKPKSDCDGFYSLTKTHEAGRLGYRSGR